MSVSPPHTQCYMESAPLAVCNSTAVTLTIPILSSTPDPSPYDAHELSTGSVHFPFAVLMCGIVSPLRFVISTVIWLSDVP